ncbi:MAG: AAA-like domain-containing protein [Lachnospiraceae bacterium]|nr:AAA-like domain-containing protein [Lachnospiraceae bacterium]
MKTFNTAVICNPQRHYMVDTSERIDRIIDHYIEPGKYFSINRGRQYGKTTTLNLLAQKLRKKYYCLQVSFAWADELFESRLRMVSGFVGYIKKELMREHVPDERILAWGREVNPDEPFSDLDVRITELCASSDRDIILMIDEVDKASDNALMLQLLGLLRDKYIQREAGRDFTFKSVILAGVYDIKNLKLKIRSEDDHFYNSPWNVAAEFEEDLSFSKNDIAGMLKEYEKDYQTGMDVASISELIYDYTSGYPVLVSDICKRLDEKVAGTEEFPNRTAAWTHAGVTEAVKIIQQTRTPLFEDMIKQIEDYPELKEVLKSILFEGESIAFNSYNKVLNLARMFDYIKPVNGRVAVSNRIFEVVLYDYFLSEEKVGNVTNRDAELNRSQFVTNGKLNMEAVLRKFADHYADVYADNDQKFIEKYARKIFLMYLKPVINGTGNYYVEAQTRDAKRTDIVVDYHGEQFVIETKIWYGPKYNADGEKQLCDYLDRMHLKKGYMLTFSFNKNKKTGANKTIIDDKELLEITV